MTLLASARIGSQRPQVEHLPPNRHSSSALEAIDFAKSVGINLLPWQEWVLDQALSEDKNGNWSAFEVGLIVPRQNGKNEILVAFELACIYLFGDKLIVHSAHKFDTSQEHFLRLQEVIEGSPDLTRKLARNGFVTANGKEAIRFASGQRIKFKARTKGGARGFTGSKIVLDEAYDLPPQAIGAMLPTLATVPNCQVWYTSSAPHVDSRVLHGIRKRGRSSNGGRLFFAEWCNEPNTPLDDRDGWYNANPSMGLLIPESFVEDEYRAMEATPEEFARERAGIAEEPNFEGTVVDLGVFDSLADPSSKIASSRCIAVDVSPERTWATIAAGGKRSDGLRHMEIVDRRAGTGWLVPELVRLSQTHGVTVILDPASPAGALVQDLKDQSVTVHEATTREVTQACGAFVDAVNNGTMRHLGGSLIRSALVGAGKRTVSDAWAWSRASSSTDITPLVAGTLATFIGTSPDADPWIAWE
jgi:hypothetical protein